MSLILSPLLSLPPSLSPPSLSPSPLPPSLPVLVVNDETTLNYICNKTAAPYFSNLVWFIGNHVIELDECLISQAQ